MTGGGLKNAAQIHSRLALSEAAGLLLIDVPEPLERLLAERRPPDAAPRIVEARGLRSVKERYPAIVLWRENRVGSESVLQAAVKRLEPGGVLWVVTAIRKVMGPETPAVHRLGVEGLRKVLEPAGLSHDREVRLSAWHVAHRFSSRER